MSRLPNITMHRDLAGVRIEGTRYALRLHPCSAWLADGDPSVHVGVFALPVGGNEHATNLTSDTTRTFALEDIELVIDAAGDELRCLRATAADLGALAFREGFVLALEPGMGGFLDGTLQLIDLISRQAAQVRIAAAAQMGRRLWPHEEEAVLEVVAKLARHGTVEGALHYAVNHNYDSLLEPGGDHPSYADLGAALRHAEVAAVLAQVAEVFRAANPA
ncbi:hypothetical protein ACI2UK_13510 [Ralstonia nicotianae]|uniref:hypothetical protein n=1 Tax=Ralstonia pseudosolanacearum TaxID=1310165 RepID=UPI0020066D00|nr:hypothetical protein [Ralstonia pseudosolanacearum]MCK4118438.1 hypothetical protein [Ralstonia pseudosolanacearum]